MNNQTNGKVSLGNKLAFACGDIFGGGSFNVINFLFTPFLTLVVGLKMVYLIPILLFTKLWDGLIDPFIGKITDGKQPGKFGKRRYFMLIFAPIVLVTFVLLFFPWNMVTSNDGVKVALVIICYMLYATAQSMVLIPYYSHASEMTNDYTERNKTNAVRLAFSIASSLVCIVLPGNIAGPTPNTEGISAKLLIAFFGKETGLAYLSQGGSYVIMSVLFGLIFCIAILITALFSREQIVTPAIKTKVSFSQFFAPLQIKTYRQYLGMQVCASMSMAVMSSFFFIFCDFYLRANTYEQFTLLNSTVTTVSRFPVATVAAALMFGTQIIALPVYLSVIKKHGKRFAYILSASIWIFGCVAMLFLPKDTGCVVTQAPIFQLAGECNTIDKIQLALANGDKLVSAGKVGNLGGTSNLVICLFGVLLGFGVCGTVYVPHSSFGDICDVGELYFGKRTEGAFSGLTNFLNTCAQALGLAIPPILTAIANYQETTYRTTQEITASQLAQLEQDFAITQVNDSYKLLPLHQSNEAQLAIKIAFIVVPMVIMAVGIVIASRFKLNKTLQQQIVETNLLDKQSQRYLQDKKQLLESL